MNRVFILISALFLYVGCNPKEPLYLAKDFVYVGDFTQGLEGPAVDKDGNLFFVNPDKNGTIGKISASGEFEIYIDSLPNGSVANGIRFDKDGLMYLADYINHNILTIDPVHKKVVSFANDTSLNQPNDIAITESGLLFASDPNWKESTGNLWRVNKNGSFQLLESDMGTTNGVEVSPGDSLLYVNESIQRKIWVYDLDSNGNISNKRLLIEFPDHYLDGMRCDEKGNLYVARYDKGVIAIISPDGKLIREIQLKAKKPTNIAFGGQDGKTCFVTCQDRGYIESFRVEYVGRSFSLR